MTGLVFSPFKKTISTVDLADVTWEGVRNWPSKHGDAVREVLDGKIKGNIEEVLDEIVYFLAFATDYAFWCQLEDKPQIRIAVRSTFMAHLRKFAQEHRCQPIPSGEWLEDSLIWIPNGPQESKDSWTNLMKRFDLYGRSLARRHDRSAGERTSHLLAAWCGTSSAVFILFTTPLFLGKWEGVQNVLKSVRIKLGG